MENEELMQPEQAPETPPAETENPPEAVTEETPKEEPVYTDEGVAEEEEETEDCPRFRFQYRHALRYLVFLLALGLCAMVLLCCAMQPLKRWLTQYESVQPQYMEQDIYDTLFADPDWGLIYDLAGVESTKFEGKETFIAYMKEKTAGKPLHCTRISLGLSGNRKYHLTCDGELLATYVMKETTGDPLYANWVLDSVEVFFTRPESVTIKTHADYTVSVNGVILDDSYLIRTTHTAAEDYLPDGLDFPRTKTYRVEGFLMEPEIAITDHSLKPLDVFYNQDLDQYCSDIPTTRPITKEELVLVETAAQVHALFSVRGCNVAHIRKVFNPNTPAYSQLAGTEPFCESYKSHAFHKNGIAVTDFYAYSDDLFTARVRVAMDVTTKEGDTVTYKLDTTYFVTRTTNGRYMVSDYMDVDLTEVREEVLLTYVFGGEILLSQLTATNSKTFPAPEITDVNGNAPIAWGIAGEDGMIDPVLNVKKNGVCVPAGDPIDAPLTLHPIFPEEAAE